MQPHQISGVPLSSNRSQKSRPQKIEGIVSFLLKKPQGSWHWSCVNNLCSPRSCKPLRDKFPALMSRVRLALKEHKVNLQLWSSTLLIPYFEGISGLMLVQYQFNVYFLPGFSAMHWLQIMATFQIFLNFRKSQIHAKKIILTNCLIIFKEKWSLKKLTRKSKFKVYGYITSLTTKST